ncbi:MAG TPA: anhydro-N-acetylmuramic acid kinase [Stellaceae bacterium]|nr:anhydro-N-acetylmuramic acid kinase [Stellaceae bacterium]
MSGRLYRALGLMSGTSLDGIDAALVTTDGRAAVEAGPAITVPYGERTRDRIRECLGGGGPAASVEEELTELHAEAVRRFLAEHRAGPLDVIGFHGQTILHRPKEGRTVQLGDGALLARRTGVDVVCDFRSADVAAGGEGAPLVPVYHAALAASLERPLAVLNLGGVANVTWLGTGGEEMLAFDTGPGNALIDDWVRRHIGASFDRDGALALAGRADRQWVARFLAHPYFARRPPKSLDRDEFRGFVPEHLAPADGAATLVAMTAAGAEAALRHLPLPPRRWLLGGGGRHNPAITAALARALGAPVEPVEAVGWDGDALEAQAFGYLAVRSLLGLPLSFPSTTGVKAPMPGGRLFRALEA